MNDRIDNKREREGGRERYLNVWRRNKWQMDRNWRTGERMNIEFLYFDHNDYVRTWVYRCVFEEILLVLLRTMDMHTSRRERERESENGAILFFFFCRF